MFKDSNKKERKAKFLLTNQRDKLITYGEKCSIEVTKVDFPGREGAVDPSKPCNELMDAVKARFEPLMPSDDLNDHTGTEKDNYELLMLTQLNNEYANQSTRFNLQALTFNTMNYHKYSGGSGGKIKTQKYTSEADQYLEFTDIEQR